MLTRGRHAALASRGHKNSRCPDTSVSRNIQEFRSREPGLSREPSISLALQKTMEEEEEEVTLTFFSLLSIEKGAGLDVVYILI